MTELPDERIKEIAKDVAHDNNVDLSDVRLVRTIDSTGASAIEVELVLTPGSTSAVMGMPSALTISRLIQKLAEEGEERLPIVRYDEEPSATTGS